MSKRVYRSRTDVMIGGVCAGIAEHLNVDVTLVRLLWVLAALLGGGGVIAYLIAWIIIPQRPAGIEGDDPLVEAEAEPGRRDEADPAISEQTARSRRRVAGVVLLFVGGLLLARNLVPWFDLDRFWPVVLIAAGLALVFRNSGERSSRG